MKTEKKTVVRLPNNAPKGDNRDGRLTGIKTDRGEFRFKANKKGE